MASTEANGRATTDIDAEETREWLEALDSVLRNDGAERARFLLERLIAQARRSARRRRSAAPTALPQHDPGRPGAAVPGRRGVEHRIRSLIRWNAIATVLQANKESSELGGHIASFQSAATLYEVGFNHFWHAPTDDHGGDLVYIQGHCSPGFYARAFLEGRHERGAAAPLPPGGRRERRLRRPGLSSYPHPWLMPDFWQFPTVSMGLGPIMAIYQARFMKYLHGRVIADTEGRKVWAFMGDGEMDEPESLGAISLAAREKLDNLIFVVNCNLQRLDGPVRGNGKIIQELETIFRGAGWNVIKVIWGDRWDPLLARDTEGRLLERMEEAVDGEYQNYKARDGAYVREHFFGKDPELLEMVANMTDDDIWPLNRGGHDPQKVYAAYAAAVAHTGQPTVILAKTIKGYGMGEAGEGQNITHQQKKMNENALLAFRDRFELDLTDEQVAEAASTSRPTTRPEMRYLRERREALGGWLPARRAKPTPLEVPELSAFDAQLQGIGRARDLHDDGVRAHPHHAAARQADRPARRPDRARRVAHVRHGGPVPPARHLQPGGPALRAGGLRPADVLPRGQAGPDPPGGHQRAGRVLVVDRRGHLVRQPRRADDPVLHLLLDVRLPARRRPRVGRGRLARARVPARRHRRAAPRSTARASSTRTATATCWRRRSPTASPTTRPTPTSSR